MEQSNEAGLPGFPTAFASLSTDLTLPENGANSFMSTLSQLSGISNLNAASSSMNQAAELAQWASVSQTAHHNWMDSAKVAAAMLPSIYIKSLKLPMHHQAALERSAAGSASQMTAVAAASRLLPSMAMLNEESSLSATGPNFFAQTTPHLAHISAVSNDASVAHIATATSLLQQQQQDQLQQSQQQKPKSHTSAAQTTTNILAPETVDSLNSSLTSRGVPGLPFSASASLFQSMFETPMLMHSMAVPMSSSHSQDQSTPIDVTALSKSPTINVSVNSPVVPPNSIDNSLLLNMPSLHSSASSIHVTDSGPNTPFVDDSSNNKLQLQPPNTPTEDRIAVLSSNQISQSDTPITSQEFENSLGPSNSTNEANFMHTDIGNDDRSCNSTSTSSVLRPIDSSLSSLEPNFSDDPPTIKTKKSTFPGEEEQDQDLDSILGFVSEKSVPKSSNSIFDFPGMDSGPGLSPVQFTPPDSPSQNQPAPNEETEVKEEKHEPSNITTIQPEVKQQPLFSMAGLMPLTTLTPQVLEAAALHMGQLHAAGLSANIDMVNELKTMVFQESLRQQAKTEEILLAQASAAVAAQAVAAQAAAAQAAAQAAVVAAAAAAASSSLSEMIEPKLIKEEVNDPVTPAIEDEIINVTSDSKQEQTISNCKTVQADKTSVKPKTLTDQELFFLKPKDPFSMKPVNKVNKIPIYKRNRTSTLFDNLQSEPKESCGDAYNFDAEEDNSFQKMKEKMQQEIDQQTKAARTNIQTLECKSKNGYIPGVGFAVSPEKQPSNVIKKRTTDCNRPTSAVTGGASSVHDDTLDGHRSNDPEIVTLAESIRRRKRERFICSFIKAESLNENECAKEQRDPNSLKLTSSELRVPKLIIRLPRKPSTDSYNEKKKKKRKRKRRDNEDSDWEEKNRPSSRNKRHPSKTRSSSTDIQSVDGSDDIDDPELQLCIKKKRINISEDAIEQKKRSESPLLSLDEIRRINEHHFEQAKSRLNKFGSACGILPKGTFVVNKLDILRDDCALWKVDNQNLLQKFPPRRDPVTKNLHYKNSSTYSGWCEQISMGYYKVSVRVLKQTRSEAIIEPEVPLSELFPATASVLSETNVAVVPDEDVEEAYVMRGNGDGLIDALYTYTVCMIDQAFTMDYLQSAKLKTDWSYLRAKNEIDEVNASCIKKLHQRMRFSENFEKALHSYACLNIVNDDSYENCTPCQLCFGLKRTVECILQLMGRQAYDEETLNLPSSNEVNNDELPAIELFACSSCASMAMLYHRCYHMKFYFLRTCEDKLENLGTQFPNSAPEKIVEMAKKRRTWQSQIQNEYCDIWKKVESIHVN